MADVIGTIGAGQTYATVALWEAAAPADLVAVDQRWIGECADEVFDERISIGSGTTTDDTRNFVLRPMTGTGFNGLAGNGPVIQYAGAVPPTTEPVHRIYGSCDLEEIEFDGSLMGTAAVFVTALSTQDPSQAAEVFWKYRRIIVHDFGDSTIERTIGVYGGHPLGSDLLYTFHLLNSVIYNIESDNVGAQGRTTGVSSDNDGASVKTIEIHNNAVHGIIGGPSGWARGISLSDLATGVALGMSNNISGGTNSTSQELDFHFGVFVPTIDNCYSEDGTAITFGGSGNLANQVMADTFLVLTPGSEDLHLKSTANAVAAGRDNGVTPAGVEIDIDGYDRNAGAVTWDIGADQEGLPSGPPVVDIDVNPTGSTLGTLASGILGLTIALDPLLPVGSTLLTLASDVPVIDVEQIVLVNPIGAALVILASGVAIIDIVSGTTSSPVGNSLSTLGENSSADLINNLEITFEAEGSSLQTIGFGNVTFAGLAADVNLLITNTSSSLLPLASGVPTIFATTVGDVSLAVGGNTLAVLGSSGVAGIIDTDNIVVIAAGNAISLVASGTPIISILATGVIVSPIGSGLAVIQSGVVSTSVSFPTAPPGTAGGRLVIRSITRDITRPIVHTVEQRIEAFNA